PEQHADRLPAQEVVGVLIARDAEDGARGIDHHQPDRGERERQHQEPPVAAAHARAPGCTRRSTSLLKRRPRSSKSWNMSKEAQAGESSTVPPRARRATSKATSAASASEPARVVGTVFQAEAMGSAPSPISTRWRTARATRGASGAKSWPLSRPPAISTTG